MTFIYVGLLRLRSLAVWWYGEETSVSLASVACSGCGWYFILALFAMSSANFTTELSPCHVCSTGFNAQTVCVGERVQYPAAECGTQRAVPFHQFYWWDCVECKSTNGIFSGLCRLSGQWIWPPLCICSDCMLVRVQACRGVIFDVLKNQFLKTPKTRHSRLFRHRSNIAWSGPLSETNGPHAVCWG